MDKKTRKIVTTIKDKLGLNHTQEVILARALSKQSQSLTARGGDYSFSSLAGILAITIILIIGFFLTGLNFFNPFSIVMKWVSWIYWGIAGYMSGISILEIFHLNKSLGKIKKELRGRREKKSPQKMKRIILNKKYVELTVGVSIKAKICFWLLALTWIICLISYRWIATTFLVLLCAGLVLFSEKMISDEIRQYLESMRNKRIEDIEETVDFEIGGKW